MDNKKTPKNAKIFTCEKCEFKCFKNSDWIRHQTARKHKMDNKWIIMDNEKNAKNNNKPTHICVCVKEYKYNTGLFKRQKTPKITIIERLINSLYLFIYCLHKNKMERWKV